MCTKIQNQQIIDEFLRQIGTKYNVARCTSINKFKNFFQCLDKLSNQRKIKTVKKYIIV